MSSVVGPAAAGGTSSDNGGGGGGEDGGGCLLCYSPNNVNAYNNTFWDVLEPLDPTLEPLVNANLWAVFVLRKLLRFTSEEVENLLVTRGGEVEPAHWFQLCSECVEWVGEFRAADKEAREGVPGAEERVNAMRRLAKEKLWAGLTSGGRRSEDVDDILDFLESEVEEEEEEVVQPEDPDGGDSEAGHSSVSSGSIWSHSSRLIEEASSSDNNPSILELGTRSNTDVPLQVTPNSIAEEMENVPSAEITATGTAARRRINANDSCKSGKKAKAGMMACETSCTKDEEGSTEGPAKKKKSSPVVINEKSHTGEKPFVCQDQECNRGFATAASLRRHKMIHTGEKPFACTYCGKRFNDRTALKRHFIIHTGERRFSCNHCGKRFGLKGNLDCHLRTHSSGVRPYACDQCSRAFSNRTALRRHLVIHSGQRPFQCWLCGTAFRHKVSLDRHIKNTHEQPKEVSKQLANDAAAQYLKTAAKNSRERETSCAREKEDSTEEGPAKKKKRSPVVIHHDHITILGGDPPMYQCNVCQKKFKTKTHIKYHQFCSGGGSKPFKCEQCGKGFIKKSHYEYHLRTHTPPGQRPYLCPICDKGFNQRGQVRRHIRSHTGERPFVCQDPECNRGFVSAAALRAHTRIHSGEMPFACTYCHKRFAGMIYLKKHVITHAGEGRYSCNHCGKRCVAKANLGRHLRTHSSGVRPYACDECSRAFSCSKDLKQHLVMQSGQRPFQCSLCGTGFSRKGNLDRHIKITHEQPKTVCAQTASQRDDRPISQKHGKESRESLTDMPMSKVNAVVRSSIINQSADLRRASIRNKVPAVKSCRSNASSMPGAEERVVKEKLWAGLTSGDRRSDDEDDILEFLEREVEEEEVVVQPEDRDGGVSEASHSLVLVTSGSISSHSARIIEGASSSSVGNGASDDNNRTILELGTRGNTDVPLQVVPNSIAEEMKDVPSAEIAVIGTAARRSINATNNSRKSGKKANLCKSGKEAGMMACETNCAKEEEGSTEGPAKKKKRSPVVINGDHITILGGDAPMYQCNVCQKKFKTKWRIKYHKFCIVGGGGDKPFKCVQCAQRFIGKGHYEYHLRTHTGKRSFLCPICDKGFNQKAKLTLHIRSHTGEKPFVCQECNRGFATAQNLRCHTRIHTGERPFACTYCGKRFIDSTALKRHFIIHTGERRFSCHHCGKRFGLKGNLDCHLRTHSSGVRPYACDQCSRAFSNRTVLRRHLVIHSGQRPFQCWLCDTAFSRKVDLDRHIKNTHEQPKEISKQLANEAATQYLENTAKNTRERESLANIPVSKGNGVVISSIINQNADLRRTSVRNKVPARKSGQRFFFLDHPLATYATKKSPKSNSSSTRPLSIVND